MLGKLSRENRLGAQSISEPVAGCIPARERLLMGGGAVFCRGESERGSWGHRVARSAGVVRPRCRTATARARQQEKRSPRLAPLVVLPGTGKADHNHRWRPEAGENSRRCAHTTRPLSTATGTRLGEDIGNERAVGRGIQVENYAAHTIVCPSMDICHLLST